MFPTDVVIIAGARTPMARYTARFPMFPRLIWPRTPRRKRFAVLAPIPRKSITQFSGNVMQTSADALYGARHVGLKAGLKMELRGDRESIVRLRH